MDLCLAKSFYKTGVLPLEEYLNILEEELSEGTPHEQIAILEHENEMLEEDLYNLEVEVRGYGHDIEYLECELQDYKEKYSNALDEIKNLEDRVNFLSDKYE